MKTDYFTTNFFRIKSLHQTDETEKNKRRFKKKSNFWENFALFFIHNVRDSGFLIGTCFLKMLPVHIKMIL